MSRNKTANVLKYLDDSALEDYAKQDRLRHSGIVEGLTQILKDAPEGACIGFFGPWGSGKTSILRALQKQWKGNFVYFDAWRHDVDSFRGELIQACYKCRPDQVRAEIRKRVKTSQTTVVKKWRWASLPEIVMGIAGGLLAATAALLLLWDPSKTWTEAFSGVGLIGVVVFVVAFVLSRIRLKEEYEIQLTEPPVTAPAEVSQLFETLLSDQLKYGDVVLAIDNLDRCDSETVVEMLACLNAFLNHKDSKCVVACDEDALVRHLESQRKGQRDVQGYLDKIFGIKVWLPAPSHSDLDKLVRELLGEIEVELPAHQRDALVYELAANPRDIKGLLNDVQAVRAIVMSQQDSQAIGELHVDDLVPKVVKLLMIRRKDREKFSQYIENPLDLVKDQRHVVEADQLTGDEVLNLLRNPPLFTMPDATFLLSWKTADEVLSNPRYAALGRVLWANERTDVLEEDYAEFSDADRYLWVGCLAGQIKERLVRRADPLRTLEIISRVGIMWETFRETEQTELAEAVVAALANAALVSGRLRQVCENPYIPRIIEKGEVAGRNGALSKVLSATANANINAKMPALQLLNHFAKSLPPDLGRRYFACVAGAWNQERAPEFAALIEDIPYAKWDVPSETMESFLSDLLAAAENRAVSIELWEGTIFALLSVSLEADNEQYAQILSAIGERLALVPNQQPPLDQEEAAGKILPKLAQVVVGRAFEGDAGSALQSINGYWRHYLVKDPEQLPTIAHLLSALGGEKALEDAGQTTESMLRQPGGLRLAAGIAQTLDELSQVRETLANHLALGLSVHIGPGAPDDETTSAILAQLADEQVLQLFQQLLTGSDPGASQQAIAVYRLLPKDRKAQAFPKQLLQRLQSIADHPRRSQASYQATVELAIQAGIDASTDEAYQDMKDVLRLTCNTQDGKLATAKGVQEAVEGKLTEHLSKNRRLSASFDVLVTTMVYAIDPSDMQEPQAELVVEALEVLAPALQSQHENPIRTADERAQQAGWDSVSTRLKELLKKCPR